MIDLRSVGGERVVPPVKAVTLRAQLRAALATSPDTLAWMKAHPEAVDRMLADAVFASYTRALTNTSALGELTEDQVRELRGPGLVVTGTTGGTQGIDWDWRQAPEGLRKQPYRWVYRLWRYFFPGRDLREAGSKQLRQIRYTPMLVLVRERETFGRQSVKVGTELSPSVPGKYRPVYEIRDVWERVRQPGGHLETWLAPDGTWQGTPPTIPNGFGGLITGEEALGRTVLDIPCDERCLSATGRKCECSCGGANHGAGVQELFIPANAAEVLATALRGTR